MHHITTLVFNTLNFKSLLLNLKAGVSVSVVFAQSMKICSSTKPLD